MSAGTWRALRTSLLPQSPSSLHSFYDPGQTASVRLHLHLLRLITTYVTCYVMWSTCFTFCQFMPPQRTNYYNSHELPAVSNTCFTLNVTLEQENEHTWNTFFSDPLCLMYSFGRNSFRLWRGMTFLHGYPFELQAFPFLLTYLYIWGHSCPTAYISENSCNSWHHPFLSTGGNPWSNSLCWSRR